jgi:hypothetical protein
LGRDRLGLKKNIEPKITVLFFDKKPLQPAAAHGCQHLKTFDLLGLADLLLMFEFKRLKINF